MSKITTEYVPLDEDTITKLEWQRYSALKVMLDIKEATRFLRLSRTIPSETKKAEIKDLLELKRNTNNRIGTILKEAIASQVDTLKLVTTRDEAVRNIRGIEQSGWEDVYKNSIKALENSGIRTTTIKNARLILASFH